MSENSEHEGLKAWACRSTEREEKKPLLSKVYSYPGLTEEEANVLALELLQAFDGQPLPVVKQVLHRAEFWLDAVAVLNCGEDTEFARAVDALLPNSMDGISPEMVSRAAEARERHRAAFAAGRQQLRSPEHATHADPLGALIARFSATQTGDSTNPEIAATQLAPGRFWSDGLASESTTPPGV